MEENDSSIKELQDFAEKTNREFSYNEIPYSGSIYKSIKYHKRIVTIPYNKERTSFFIWYNDPRNFSKNSNLCGAFIPVKGNISSEFRIRKKDISDKINPFSKKSVFITGIKQFDRNVCVSGKEVNQLHNLLNNRSVQNLIINGLNQITGCMVLYNEINLDFIPEFENQSNLGFAIMNKWIYEAEIIDFYFHLAELMREYV